MYLLEQELISKQAIEAGFFFIFQLRSSLITYSKGFFDFLNIIIKTEEIVQIKFVESFFKSTRSS